MANKKPRTVLFYGMSGAGKGTQAKLLVEKLRTKRNTHFIETGQLLRDYIGRSGTHGAVRMRETMNSGGLLPAAISTYMWSGILIKSVGEHHNVVFDGAARRANEASLLDGILRWLGRDYTVFMLEIDEQTAIDRAESRGEGRPDDTDEAMVKRLEWFEQHTVPAIEYMAEQGAQVHRIDGSRSIEEVHQEILEKLEL